MDTTSAIESDSATPQALGEALRATITEIIDLTKRATVAQLTGNGQHNELLRQIAAAQIRANRLAAELASRAQSAVGGAIALNDIPGEFR